jgi:tRNA and rRNA cytosine-C5-methylases
VSASVELARVVLGDGRAKFVNAVLRKVARQDLDAWLEQVAPPYDEDPEDHLAVVHSHPRWVVSALWDALGGGRAGIEDLLEADNERPEVTLVARPGAPPPRNSSAFLGRSPRCRDAGRRTPCGSPRAVSRAPSTPSGRAGRASRTRAASWWRSLSRTRRSTAPTGPGWTAAPDPAARPRCWRASPPGEARRCSPRRSSRTGPGSSPRRSPGTPAPTRSSPPTGPARRGGPAPSTGCSWTSLHGLGALRRRPEARWRRRPEDLEGFAPLQRGLLRTALESVRVGGVVGYATCSPHLAETRAVVDDVLKHFEGGSAELFDARPLLPGVPGLGDGPDVQLWPHLHGTDAMYLALIRRTG